MIAIIADEASVGINGSVADLESVRLKIAELVQSGDSSVMMDAAMIDPNPYPRTLRALEIRRGEGRTTITIAGDRVTVTGSDESLDRFSSWFHFPADAQQGRHAHFEPAPGDPFHSSESIPLIISLRHIVA
jgi:hypothetical protein